MNDTRKLVKLISVTFVFFCGVNVLMATPNFTAQSGVVLSTASPQSIDISSTPARLYYLHNPFEVRSATSSDRITWSEESGIRLSTSTVPDLIISSITGCSVLPLNGGGYRMLYSVQKGTNVWSIVSATSTDGLAWANTAGTVISVATNTFVGIPRLVELTNGDWRMFYLQDSNGGNDQRDRVVNSVLSTDEGLTWSSPAVVLSEPGGEIASFQRTDKKIRLFLTQPLTTNTTNTVLVSALSSDSNGTSFTLENNTRFSTSVANGGISHPLVFKSTDGYHLRLFYGFVSNTSTTPVTLQALTVEPDPQSLSPGTILRTAASTDFTITGEVFGSTPTVVLRKSGQSDVGGTGVTLSSDQSMTATFATNGLALGSWNIVVTNPDAASGTLTNALGVDFAEGEVTLLDNLLRPRNGAVTRIAITIFDAGFIRVQLYTLEGKPLRILYEGDAALGTITLTWDGKTSDNNIVASGTYLLRIDGPKTHKVEKIVVIR